MRWEGLSLFPAVFTPPSHCLTLSPPAFQNLLGGLEEQEGSDWGSLAGWRSDLPGESSNDLRALSWPGPAPLSPAPDTAHHVQLSRR